MPAAAQNYSDGFRFLQAVEKMDQGKVQDLINKNGTIVDSRDLGDGHTALHTVVNRRDSAWLRYLLTEGANPNIADKNGVTPLMLATQTGFVDGVAMLAAKGARVDTDDSTGETPLILAVHKHDIPMVRMLLAAGADPNKSDNSGRTARDYARLDGAGSLALEEIEKHDKDKTANKPAQVYGPTF
ncbi:MAG: ankyrin repeat domain-containing protein [Porphyrobacter sp.]|nr:ankyrin repeat domain-containing protein [Porphyrobacter sp.]